MLTFPSDPTTCGTPPKTTGLALASSKKINFLPVASNLNYLGFFFFSNSKILRPLLPGMTSFTSPVPFSIWGFYCDIYDCHILPTRAWTPALNVCTYLTHALSRKVLSLTKPKGKIYKMKNDNIKKIPPQLYNTATVLYGAAFKISLWLRTVFLYSSYITFSPDIF